MFEKLGGFDERLPVSWEDTEICWRAWLNGWACVFVPEAVCWHRVGASISDNPQGGAARFRGTVGGRLLFASKHLPSFYMLNTWVVSCLGIGKDILTVRFGEAVAKGKVIAEYARLLPKLLVERRRLYREAGVKPSTQLRRMLRIGQAQLTDGRYDEGVN
jgi:GT2 family glycosyltransferase